MNKVVWKLSDDEKKEIQNLFEKKIALENLVKIIDPANEKLYNKLISDYGTTVRLFEQWWTVTSQKNKWEGKNWRINFETNEVLAQ
ncbi:MAG TPA: CXXX repeat peptide modification system protein [Clostridiales bacterium]|nr:CXXX repeat peptide modification system protein [Clostridiales bacterium]